MKMTVQNSIIGIMMWITCLTRNFRKLWEVWIMVTVTMTGVSLDGTGQVNQAGIDHYNELINALLAKGIEPYVTIYHWDLPQALQDRYNGWIDRQIIKDYSVYAETCFKAFGDRVKHWTTINKPHTFAIQGYDVGLQAPGRCSITPSPFLQCREFGN